MSLLFESESSTARLSVSTTGVELAAGADGACCARMWYGAIAAANIPRATRSFKAMLLPPTRLFIAQRFDRFERRRLLCRQPSKKKPRRARHQKRQHHAHSGNRHAQIPRQKLLHDYRNTDADQDSNHRTATADQKGFNEELPHDLALRGANRFAHADFACALLDRHQHDIHDADAADQQRDERNYNQYDAQ